MNVAVSVAIISITLLACDSARKRISSSNEVSKFLADIFVSVELCAVVLECGVILDHYGLGLWTLFCFLNGIYQMTRWKNVTPPVPQMHIVAWINGRQSMKEALLRTAVIVVAGVGTYRFFMSNLWTSLSWSPIHADRAEQTSAGICEFPFQNVPAVLAFSAEAIGSYFLSVVGGLVADHPTLSNNDPVWSAIVMSVTACLTIHCALGISGGIFNPMLATVLVSGCNGHSALDHLFVYWFGAILGAILANASYGKIKNFVYGDLSPIHKKKE